MEGYLLDSVKRTLMTELQSKGYAPHISDIHPAAVKLITLIEADFRARFVNDKASVETLAEVDKVEDEMTPSDSRILTPVTPVTSIHPVGPAVAGSDTIVSRGLPQTQTVVPQDIPQKTTS